MQVAGRFPQFTFNDNKWAALIDPKGGVLYADKWLWTFQVGFEATTVLCLQQSVCEYMLYVCECLSNRILEWSSNPVRNHHPNYTETTPTRKFEFNRKRKIRLIKYICKRPLYSSWSVASCLEVALATYLYRFWYVSTMLEQRRRQRCCFQNPGMGTDVGRVCGLNCYSQHGV